MLSEAGLFATVTLGFVVANQRLVSTRNIKGFGETLEVLIIGTLFIILGALVKIDDLVDYAGQIAGIVAVLVLVVRPLVAAVSLVGTPLTGRDRAMVGWMDPRGIVAAATATAFAATLDSAGFDADFLLPVSFGVILGTGVIYGLTAKPAAGLLGVARPSPTGIGIIGDDPWLVPFAEHLTGAGVDTLLVTTTPTDVARPATGDGGAALRTTSLTEGLADVKATIKEASLARAVVSVDPDAALALLEAALINLLGRRAVLRVPREQHAGIIGGGPTRRTAYAFRGDVTRVDISDRFDAGATVQTITSPVPHDAFLLAAISPGGDVDLNPTTDTVSPNDTLIALVAAGDAPDTGRSSSRR